MSLRRVGVLVKHLPLDSALVRALSGGEAPMNRLENLVADVWALWAKKDHPKRAKLEAAAKLRAKEARVIELRSKFEERKRKNGLK